MRLHLKNGPHQLPCGLHSTDGPFTHYECGRPATLQVVGTRTCLAAPNSATHTHTQSLWPSHPLGTCGEGVHGPRVPCEAPRCPAARKGTQVAPGSGLEQPEGPRCTVHRQSQGGCRCAQTHPAPYLQRASQQVFLFPENTKCPSGPPTTSLSQAWLYLPL